MKNIPFGRIALIVAVILIIPLVATFTVEGFNWQWHEFVFAFVFLSVAGVALSWVGGTRHSVLLRIGIVLIFAAVWVRLATG
jgi:hypothetical protein